MKKLDNGMMVLDFEEFQEDLRLRNVARLYANIPGQESTEEEIYQSLVATEEYNKTLYEKTDKLLDYSDEIVSIVEIGDGDTIDISVAGDQLFYANDILTKNSAGLAATADFILAVIETEELIDAGQQLIKQIKSRYGDKSVNNKFLLGVKKGNQRWIELDKDSIEANESYQKTAKDQGSPKTARSKIDDLVKKEKTESPKADSKNIDGFKF